MRLPSILPLRLSACSALAFDRYLAVPGRQQPKETYGAFVHCPMSMLSATTAMAEVPGEDHPLLPRYEGAEIRAYRAASQDSAVIPAGRVGDEKAASLARQISGSITHIDYVLTPATATAQVGLYYEGVLQSASFRQVFSCVGEKACGSGMGALIFNSGKVAPTGFADGLFGDRMRVIVAQRGDTWALLHIYEGPDRTTIYEAVVDNAG